MRNPRLCLLGALALVGACSETAAPVLGFTDGVEGDPQIGLVVNSTGRALRLFQLGRPTETRDISFGASSAITPTSIAVRGDWAVVPLGNAASIAVINVPEVRVHHFVTFPSGNTTGSTFVNDNTVLAANSITNVVGRFTLDQAAGTITDVVSVAPLPTALVMSAGRAVVVSSNLDENFAPIGDGIVTFIDPGTMAVLGTVTTGGTNPTSIAAGQGSLVYVVNTTDYFTPDGSVAVIDAQTMQRVAVVPGFGVGPGAISIDRNGLAYVSAFFSGTLVWNTTNQTFLRDADNPVCARLPNGSCRGAFGARADSAGRLYQLFFGSASQNLPPWVFVYQPVTFALSDSISSGQGPTAIEIRTF